MKYLLSLSVSFDDKRILSNFSNYLMTLATNANCRGVDRAIYLPLTLPLEPLSYLRQLWLTRNPKWLFWITGQSLRNYKYSTHYYESATSARREYTHTGSSYFHGKCIIWTMYWLCRLFAVRANSDEEESDTRRIYGVKCCNGVLCCLGQALMKRVVQPALPLF
jgi:hypothetical protein